MADSALPQLTAELSTLSLTGPALTNAVLLNRDLFLHITRFCELGALSALSATCKALEESVNPIGGTTSLRTSQAHDAGGMRLQQDIFNYYGGTHNSTPGPGSYPIDQTTGLGKQLMRRCGTGLYAGTMGTAERDCLLPSGEKRKKKKKKKKKKEGGSDCAVVDSRVLRCPSLALADELERRARRHAALYSLSSRTLI